MADLAQLIQRPDDAFFAHFVGGAWQVSDLLSALTVVRSAQCRDAGEEISIELHIIAESHCIAFTNADGQVLYGEVLGCTELAGLEHSSLQAITRVREVRHARKNSSGVHEPAFASRAWIADELPNDFLAPTIALVTMVSFAFPGEQEPRTIIALSKTGELQWLVRTVHEYPVEDSERVDYLLSESVVSFG